LVFEEYLLKIFEIYATNVCTETQSLLRKDLEEVNLSRKKKKLKNDQQNVDDSYITEQQDSIAITNRSSVDDAKNHNETAFEEQKQLNSTERDYHSSNEDRHSSNRRLPHTLEEVQHLLSSLDQLDATTLGELSQSLLSQYEMLIKDVSAAQFTKIASRMSDGRLENIKNFLLVIEENLLEIEATENSDEETFEDELSDVPVPDFEVQVVSLPSPPVSPEVINHLKEFLAQAEKHLEHVFGMSGDALIEKNLQLLLDTMIVLSTFFPEQVDMFKMLKLVTHPEPMFTDSKSKVFKLDDNKNSRLYYTNSLYVLLKVKIEMFLVINAN
jgi:hypothetical protein